MDYVDEDISNVSKPTTSVLMCQRGERNSVRLDTEENAQEYIDNLRKDFQNINPPYVRLEIGADDRE